MKNKSKIIQAFTEPKTEEYLDLFIERMKDALHLLEAMQEELEKPHPKVERCLSFFRAGVSCCSAVDELRCILLRVEAIADNSLNTGSP
jgi:hypothetical protein